MWTGGPGLDPYCWLGVGWQRRGALGILGNTSHQWRGNWGGGGGGDRAGVTVHFPCRLGVGVRASETCTPTQEETGLRLFDLKPQDGACSNFSNVVAHLLGRGIGKKNSARISG